MPPALRLLVISLSATLAACRGHYLVERGDAAAARGAAPRALANYQAALSEVQGEQRFGVFARRDALALQILAPLLAAGWESLYGDDPDEAARVARGLLASGLYESPRAQDEARRILAAAAEAKWPEVEALVNDGRALEASVEAWWLTAPLPERHPLVVRRSALFEPLADAALRQAGGAAGPGARLFHLRRAQQLGARVDAEVRAAAAEVEARRRAGLHLELSGPPECAPLLELLGARSRPAGPVSAHLRLTRCAFEDARWRERQVMSATRRVPSAATLEEPVASWAHADPACAPETPCERFDDLGVCIRRAARPEGCAAPELRETTRVVPATRWLTVTGTRAVEVHHRRMSATFAGSLEVAEPLLRVRKPYQLEARHQDSSFWTPERARSFDPVDQRALWSRLSAEAERALAAETEVLTRELLRRTAERPAADEAGELELEEAAALLIAAGAALPDAAARHFGARYHLGADTLGALSRGALAREPSPAQLTPLPGAERSWFHDRRHGLTPRAEVEHLGLELVTRGGVDVSFGVSQSPLGVRQHELGVDFRLHGLRFGAAGSTAPLGGDVRGHRLHALHTWGDAADDPILFTFGLATRFERDATSGRFELVTLPLELAVPLGRRLWLEAGVQPNLLMLTDLLADGPRPSRASPIYGRLGVDLLGHGFVRGTVTHYLGGGQERPIHAGLELGVRL